LTAPLLAFRHVMWSFGIGRLRFLMREKLAVLSKNFSPDQRRAISIAAVAHALHDGYTDLIYIMLPLWQAEFGLTYAALGVLRDDELVANARERGEQMLAGARSIANEYPSVIREARGLGLLVGIDLRNEGYAGTIVPEMLRHGVTAAWTLNRQRVIRLEPPLIVSADEVERALAALRAGVHAAHDRLGPLPDATTA